MFVDLQINLVAEIVVIFVIQVFTKDFIERKYFSRTSARCSQG